MAYVFNANEIFEIAETIERNGSAFYRAAAGASPDEKTRALLLQLADMERDHESIFAKMREALGESAKSELTPDPLGEGASLMAAFASNSVFDRSRDPLVLVAGTESLNDIIEVALSLEKDSIVFYTMMKKLVPSSHGREKLDTIISEEATHIVQLSGLKK